MLTVKYPILFIARKESKMSQEKVAMELGVTRVTYGLKESGKVDFTLEEAKILSELYEMPIDELFSCSIKVGS
ncbi:helix-turn-helix transcriptional regulator [Staphylococcus kloosii]|jgi:putative transcriptional regulator|uniref:helix-turn-helix transcriptional regulator n=1 Tax=Staphylococcus kloosii TaxID=29384 RepID=UPI00189FE73D|nr:helix-turn-helix transcriptional regulator [Staphylococcus kloosii]MBF7023643.1 helix-turn-helix transcriptional regulator [Staphylococcus kloosii]